MSRSLIACGLVMGLAGFQKPAEGTATSVPFIHAPQVHLQGIKGHSITVAVIDTGVNLNNPGLARGIAPGGISIINGQRINDGGEDIYDDGHGTYMSLIITDETGVAPAAKILPVRVLGPGGLTRPSDARRAIEYVIEKRRAAPSIRVINLSLGGTIFYPCSCDNASDTTARYAAAISAAAANGIITFAMTGNDAACGGILAPACVSDAVRVAASYDGNYPSTTFGLCNDFQPQAYRVTCFSNIAEDCNWLLAAPGFDISVRDSWPADADWGTSQATAHCSGLAALMFDKGGCSLDAYTARSILFTTPTLNI